MSRKDEEMFRKRQTDQGFKRIMHNTDMLCWVLKNCVEPYYDCTMAEIRKCLDTDGEGEVVRGIETESIDDSSGPVFMDTAFSVRLPGGDGDAVVYLNVEGQGYHVPFDALMKRAAYYLGRAISKQKKVGAEDPYSGICHTYGVWLDYSGGSGSKVDVYRWDAKRVSGDGDPEQFDMFRIVLVAIDGRHDLDSGDFLGLMTAVFKSDADDIQLESLLKHRYKFRETASIIGGRNIMTLSERLVMDAYNDGKRTNLISNIVAVIGKYGGTIDDAMDLFSVPPRDRSGIRAEVEEKLSSGS